MTRSYELAAKEEMKITPKIRKPRWSIQTHFWAALCIVLLTSTIVIFVMKRALWVELEVVVGLVSTLHLIYMYLLVYRGVRVNKNESFVIDWKPFKLENSGIEHLWAVDTGGAFTTAFAEAGPIGCLAGIVLDVVVSIFLVVIIAFLLWVGMNVITSGILILSLPIFILFKHSLRVAIVKGRTCQRNASKSISYAVRSTILNMTWLYAVVYLGHSLHDWLK
jgi:hypothetical protein